MLPKYDLRELRYPDSLVEKLNRAAKAKKPRPIRLSPTEAAAICGEVDGWTDWRGRQIVVECSARGGKIWKLG